MTQIHQILSYLPVVYLSGIIMSGVFFLMNFISLIKNVILKQGFGRQIDRLCLWLLIGLAFLIIMKYQVIHDFVINLIHQLN